MADENSTVARRRALAEALKNGQDVVVTPSGQVETKQEAIDQGETAIAVPEGKLA